MNFESIKRLGLEKKNIDPDESYETFDPNTNNHTIIIHLKKPDIQTCSLCASIDSHESRGSKPYTIKYSTSVEDNITIRLYRRVYRCKSCGHYFKEDNPFLDQGRTISFEKEMKILHALKNKANTYSEIAQRFNVSATYVCNLFDTKVSMKRHKFPLVLCADEVYARKLGYKHYCFIMYDPLAGIIIDVLPSRNKDFLDNYLSKISKDEKNEVRYFSIDLYDTYRRIAQKHFKNALICADSFHVIKNLSICFHEVRLKVMRKYQHLKYEKDNYYWLFKDNWKLLTTDRIKLSYKKHKIKRTGQYISSHEKVDYMLSIDEDLKKAYELYHLYLTFNQTATIDNVREWLEEIIHEYKISAITEFVSGWKMLENWKEEIVNSFSRINDVRISNGPMERLNGSVKLLFKVSFGMSNFERTRNRIMYSLNTDSEILARRAKKTNKRNFKKRGKYRIKEK